jgi:abnormal spindle-like microcephaly-associated protein
LHFTRSSPSLDPFSLQRQLHLARQAAAALFQSEAVQLVLNKVYSTVEAGGLQFRDDQSPWADVGLRQVFVSGLTCYNPVWLRLGLETVFGEPIPFTEAVNME